MGGRELISLRSRQEQQTYTFTRVIDQEIAAAAAAYPALPDIKGLEAAAGVQLANSFGLG